MHRHASLQPARGGALSTSSTCQAQRGTLGVGLGQLRVGTIRASGVPLAPGVVHRGHHILAIMDEHATAQPSPKAAFPGSPNKPGKADSTDLDGPQLLRRIVLGLTCAALIVVGTVLDSSSASRGAAHAQVHASGAHEGQLLLVQAVFRHGARTPLSTMYWPDTEYSDCSNSFPGAKLALKDESGGHQNMTLIDLDEPVLPGGCRMGQLTGPGYAMATDLGAWLRHRYSEQLGFLDPEFKAEQVHPRSTRYQRTVQTLQGVLTGMYPSLSSPSAPLVTVAASAVEKEFEYGNNVTCPALTPLYTELHNKVDERDKTDRAVAAQAQEVAASLHLGSAANVTWVRLHDALAAMRARGPGHTMPEGYSEPLYEMITHQAVHHEADIIAPTPGDGLINASACSKTIQLSIGPLLWHLQDNIEATAKQHGLVTQDGSVVTHSAQQQQGVQLVSRKMLRETESGSARAGVGSTEQLPKLFLYSGHDSTITPLLAALGVPETNWPPFTANIVWELWNIPGAVGSTTTPTTTTRSAGAATADSSRQLWVRVLYNRKPLNLEQVMGDTAGAAKSASSSWLSPRHGWVTATDLNKLLTDTTASAEQHAHDCHL